jgi:hypothetical protein
VQVYAPVSEYPGPTRETIGDTPGCGVERSNRLADALKEVIPFTSRHKAANGLVVSLDALLIEALFEWESVYSARFTNEEITERRRKLMELRHEAEVEHFPTGDLPEREDLLTLAEAVAYLEAMFEPVARAYFEGLRE